MQESTEVVDPWVLRGAGTSSKGNSKGKASKGKQRWQDDCWSYITEIAAILMDAPDAGGWAVASKLQRTYSITVNFMTVDRWLKQHREALLAGTLERPMIDEDGRPEDYADQIKAILKDEPHAERGRVHSELKRLYQVVVPHKRLRTYLASLDRSTIASTAGTAIEPSRRRTPKQDGEHGSDWLLFNEDFVFGAVAAHQSPTAASFAWAMAFVSRS